MIFQLLLSSIRSETLSDVLGVNNGMHEIEITDRNEIGCDVFDTYKNVKVNIHPDANDVKGNCKNKNINKLEINCKGPDICSIKFMLLNNSSIDIVDFSNTQSGIYINKNDFLNECNMNIILLNSSKIQTIYSEKFSQFSKFHEMYLENEAQIHNLEKQLLSSYGSKDIAVIGKVKAYIFNMSYLPKFSKLDSIAIYSNSDISDLLNFKGFQAKDIFISTSSPLTIHNGTFNNMKKLNSLIIKSNKIVFKEGSVVNCKELVTFDPSSDDAVVFEANSIKNIGILEFKIQPNFQLEIGSFSKCSELENITLARGVTTFSGGYFLDCEKMRNVKT